MKSLSLLFFVLIVLLFAGCTTNKESKVVNPNSKEYEKAKVSHEDLELAKLKSSGVKSRKIYSKFSDKYIRGGGKEILVEKTNLDNNGFRKEQFRYISNGGVDLQWLFDYDYYGRLTSTETFDGFRKKLYQKNISYNNDGTINKVEVWSEKTSDYSTSKYFYDKKLDLIEVKHFDPKGRILSLEKYLYKNNKLDSLYYLNPKSELISDLHFEYDSLGRRVKEITHSIDGRIRTTEIEYDKRNNIIAINNSVLSSFKYSYDESNNLVLEEEFNSQGFLQSKFEYTYDTKTNLPVSKIRYDGEDDEALFVRYEYEFY